jgi:arabinogalactan endo-1,4-beta-galactosidase
MKMFAGLLFVAALVASSYACARQYAIGADISFLRQAEKQVAVFKEDETPKPVLEILKSQATTGYACAYFIRRLLPRGDPM